MKSQERDCRRCFFSQVPDVNDRFYQEAVLPYIYFSAFALFLSYLIGLLFTLHTHAAVIWTTELEEKKPSDTLTSSGVSNVQGGSFHEHPHNRDPNTLTRQTTSGSLDRSRNHIRDSQLYQRILGQSLRQNNSTVIGGDLAANSNNSTWKGVDGQASLKSPHIVPPMSREGEVPPGFNLASLSAEENQNLTQQVNEIAATAAAIAARDATRPRKTTHIPQTRVSHAQIIPPGEAMNAGGGGIPDLQGHSATGGHDAPNWSRTKSAVILMSATLAYAVIAEILVNTVDSVLDNVDIDEKFLGITLFALVPNTTEFLNAISFAMNGNIALSMEIGSAYALQVCLLQIPALVLYSAVYGRFIDPMDVMDHTFTLIFPQWDMVTVILCVFLLRYAYISLLADNVPLIPTTATCTAKARAIISRAPSSSCRTLSSSSAFISLPSIAEPPTWA
jgi:Ca2+:H+ antiporter